MGTLGPWPGLWGAGGVWLGVVLRVRNLTCRTNEVRMEVRHTHEGDLFVFYRSRSSVPQPWNAHETRGAAGGFVHGIGSGNGKELN